MAVTVGADGTVYFLDGGSAAGIPVLVRSICSGVIHNLAGMKGTTGRFNGGTKVATFSMSNTNGYQLGLTVDPTSGTLYLTDTGNFAIRSIMPYVSNTATPSSQPTGQPSRQPSSQPTTKPTVHTSTAPGTLTIVAGTVAGTAGLTVPGFAATATLLNQPAGLFVDTLNNLYITQAVNHQVIKVNGSTGVVSLLAGDPGGTTGYNGDDIAASAAKLKRPVSYTKAFTRLQIIFRTNSILYFVLIPSYPHTLFYIGGRCARYGREYLHLRIRWQSYSNDLGSYRSHIHRRWKRYSRQHW